MHAHHSDNNSAKEYTKLAFVIVAILVVAIGFTIIQEFALTNLIGNIMGVFFLVFATFKIFDLNTFALTYRSYDLIARKWIGWGYVYPFVQLFLGACYMLLGDVRSLDVVTLVIMSIASVGVYKEIQKKSKIQCACLGTFIKLPLSKVSFVEDFSMVAMALIMIFF